MNHQSLRGIGASPGAAIGQAYVLDRRRVTAPHRHVDASEVSAEILRFREAIEKSDRQLTEVRRRLSAGSAEHAHEHALILEAHRLMLVDPDFTQAVEAMVAAETVNAEWAVRRVVTQLAARFDALEDPYFRERRQDVDFVGDRVLHNLMGRAPDATEPPPPGSVLVAHELSPAEALDLLPGGRIVGIVTNEGGQTAHTAIVARALGVPAVLGLDGATDLIASGEWVAIDGSSGVVVVDPSVAEQAAFRDVRARWEAQEEESLQLRDVAATTVDGLDVTLRANIELVAEVPGCIAHGADGVGLYRTEFLYLGGQAPPSEEEHYRTYRALLESLPGRTVTVRTLDLGGDKILPGDCPAGDNPALGLRAIRFCLSQPELFLTQLRALWRASVHGRLRVMFPLVSGLDELRQARDLWWRARDEVCAAGLPVAEDVPLGIMVETPAAAVMAAQLAREVAFFALGTNDLIQYTLAIDRGNPDVSYLYDPIHPAILAMIAQVATAARTAGISVSVCGEMAASPLYAPVLLALGITELSMGGHAIPAVKQVIRQLSRAEAALVLELVQSAPSLSDADCRLRSYMAQRFPSYCATPQAMERLQSCSTSSVQTPSETVGPRGRIDQSSSHPNIGGAQGPSSTSREHTDESI